MMQLANERLSEWRGRPCTCEHGFEMPTDGGIAQPTRYWGSCAMHSNGGEAVPYFTSNAAALELLEVLFLKNLPHKLEFVSSGQSYNFEVASWHGKEGFRVYAATRRNISDAICGAILLMLEKES